MILLILKTNEIEVLKYYVLTTAKIQIKSFDVFNLQIPFVFSLSAATFALKPNRYRQM